MYKLLLSLIFCLSFALTANAVEKETITLAKDNTLVLDTAFNGPSTTKLMEQATAMDASLPSGYPIYLFLYTPGGSVQAGLELFEFLAGLNRPVHTVTLFAASMGFQTVQHLGTRYIVNYGVLMSHYPRGGSSGEFGGTGMPSKKRSYDELWQRRIDLMDKKTVERTEGKQTIESYRKAYMFDLWLNGAEAVEQGYADKIAVVKCAESLSGERENMLDFGFARLYLTFSQCPMKTYPLKIRVEFATTKGFMEKSKFIAEGGKFGEECFPPAKQKTGVDEVDQGYSFSNSYGGYNSYNYRNSYQPLPEKFEDKEQKAKKEEKPLCVTDKSVTLEYLDKLVSEQKAFYRRNLKDHIEYSY